MIQLPKRLSLQEIQDVLGEHAAEKLITAFLRKKASQIVPITLADLDKAEAIIDGEGNKHSLYALGKITLKRISESDAAKSHFVRYLNSLRKVADEKSLPKKRGRPAKN